MSLRQPSCPTAILPPWQPSCPSTILPLWQPSCPMAAILSLRQPSCPPPPCPLGSHPAPPPHGRAHSRGLEEQDAAVGRLQAEDVRPLGVLAGSLSQRMMDAQGLLGLGCGVGAALRSARFEEVEQRSPQHGVEGLPAPPAPRRCGEKEWGWGTSGPPICSPQTPIFPSPAPYRTPRFHHPDL